MDSTHFGAKTLDAKTIETESTHIGAKMSDHKIPTTDYSAFKEKARK